MTPNIFALVLGLAALAQGGISGTWKGRDASPGNIHAVEFYIAEAPDGLYLGRFKAPEIGFETQIDLIQVTGNKVRFEIKTAHTVFEGTINAPQNRLTGVWTQDRPEPLELVRVGSPPRETRKPSKIANLPDSALQLSPGIGPMPFLGSDHKTHLAYEVVIENSSAGELHLTRLEVLDGNLTLAVFEKADLNSALEATGNDLDHRNLGPGKRAVAFLWITLPDGAAPPTTLRHRITVDGYSFEGGTVAVSRDRPVVIGPPLRGSDWAALDGPANESLHRRARIAIAGRERIMQRFAIDWLKIEDDGKTSSTFSGDPRINKNYYAYGSDVLAVAAGVVVEIHDGMPENIPGIKSRAVRITMKNLFGNHVVLDLGGDRYALYAHLQPGSLRVKTGDRLQRGQVLGLVGNSGNSTEPHLHFQITDGIVPLESEGLPYAIDSWEALKGAAAGIRHEKLPLNGDRVRFP